MARFLTALRSFIELLGPADLVAPAHETPRKPSVPAAITFANSFCNKPCCDGSKLRGMGGADDGVAKALFTGRLGCRACRAGARGHRALTHQAPPALVASPLTHHAPQLPLSPTNHCVVLAAQIQHFTFGVQT